MVEYAPQKVASIQVIAMQTKLVLLSSYTVMETELVKYTNLV